jgi:hypothetical protein
VNRVLNASNLLDLWILARLAVTLSTVALVSVGSILALRLAWRWRTGESGERQLRVERQAELVATALQVGMLFSVGGVLLTVLAAERLTATIRGAMCAYGVLASTESGFTALAAGGLAAGGGALWWLFHRYDLALGRPVLTRRKLFAAAGVGVLVAADAFWTVRFVLQLDFQVIASCCSVFLDGDVAAFRAASLPLSAATSGGLGVAAGCLALIAALAAGKHPGPWTGVLVTLASLLGGILGLAAIVWVVAPHVYATPYHVCPFCLLNSTGLWLGWLLFPAVGVATTLGLGIGLVEMNRRVAGQEDVTDAFVRRMGRSAAIAWAFALLIAVGAVLGYVLRSGGVSVFGEVG